MASEGNIFRLSYNQSRLFKCSLLFSSLSEIALSLSLFRQIATLECIFFSKDTKRNCLYLTKGASFHSSSRPDNFLCSWAKHSTLTVPQLGVYKWVKAYCLGSPLKWWEVTLQRNSIIQGVEVILPLALY